MISEEHTNSIQDNFLLTVSMKIVLKTFKRLAHYFFIVMRCIALFIQIQVLETALISGE